MLAAGSSAATRCSRSGRCRSSSSSSCLRAAAPPYSSRASRARQPSRRQCAAAASAAPKVAELPPSLQKIVGAFQMVPDPMARYKQLLFYAAKLPPMAPELHSPDNKVEGCVSQVWVHPELRDDGRVYWTADSDSQLTKGLAALLVLGLSGCTPGELLGLSPDFIALLGLQQALTPSRNNGFLNMFLKMQKATLPLAVAQSGSGKVADSS